MLILISVYGYGGFGHYSVGVARPDISKLREFLKQKGYSDFDNIFITTGGSGYAVFKKFVIGGESNSLKTITTSSDSSTAYISGGYWQFNLGYLLYSNKMFNSYAIFGVGKDNLEITTVENFSGNFENIFDNPPKSAKYSTEGFFFTVSLQGDVFLYGLNIGLRVGYGYSLKGGWKVWDKDVSGGPKVGLDGPFIRLIIGGGIII